MKFSTAWRVEERASRRTAHFAVHAHSSLTTSSSPGFLGPGPRTPGPEWKGRGKSLSSFSAVINVWFHLISVDSVTCPRAQGAVCVWLGCQWRVTLFILILLYLAWKIPHNFKMDLWLTYFSLSFFSLRLHAQGNNKVSSLFYCGSRFSPAPAPLLRVSWQECFCARWGDLSSVAVHKWHRVCKCRGKHAFRLPNGCSVSTFWKGNVISSELVTGRFRDVEIDDKGRDGHWEQRLWRFSNEVSLAERLQPSDETQRSWRSWPKVKALMLMCSYKNPKPEP